MQMTKPFSELACFLSSLILELRREAQLAPTMLPWTPYSSLETPPPKHCLTICPQLWIAHGYSDVYQGWHHDPDEKAGFCWPDCWEGLDLHCKVSWKKALQCFDTWSNKTSYRERKERVSRSLPKIEWGSHASWILMVVMVSRDCVKFLLSILSYFRSYLMCLLKTHPTH